MTLILCIDGKTVQLHSDLSRILFLVLTNTRDGAEHAMASAPSAMK